MYRVVSTAFRKTAGIFGRSGNPNPSNKAHSTMARGRRKDDAAFIVIAGLLTLLFFVQLGWMVVNKS